MSRNSFLRVRRRLRSEKDEVTEDVLPLTHGFLAFGVVLLERIVSIELRELLESVIMDDGLCTEGPLLDLGEGVV